VTSDALVLALMMMMMAHLPQQLEEDQVSGLKLSGVLVLKRSGETRGPMPAGNRVALHQQLVV